MIKKIVLTDIGIVLTGTLLMSQNIEFSNEDSLKPNIVFILADDLGWSDLGCYGSKFYETPNIDKLASEAIRFTNAYAACHVSSPTRASILTGKYPARTHLSDWLPGRKNYPFQKLQNADPIQHLPYSDNNTIANILKKNGYETAIIGKWHLGEDSASCERQGFDMHIPSEWLKGWPAKGGYFSPYQMPGLEDGVNGEYLTDRLTDEALKFMEENQENPFFLYLAHYAVHDPIQGRPDLVEKYENKLKQLNSPIQDPFILEGNPDSKKPISREKLNSLLKHESYEGFSLFPDRIVKIKQNQDNVQFAAMVESLDESVGRILDKLKELNLDDNTIVIFFSDNGGMSAANFGNPKRKIDESELDQAFATSNLPLRGGKGWLYEGGIRVPLIIKLPNQKDKANVCDIPIISVDFFPTILEVSNINFNSDELIMDGKSIVPLFKANLSIPSSLEKRAIYWHFPHYSNHGLQSPGGAIRFGDYKLLDYFENNTLQLFNLSDDPGEQNDLAKKEPQIAAELKKMLDNWRKEVNADIMLNNPNYQPNLMPEYF